jgi:hypothetical protein
MDLFEDAGFNKGDTANAPRNAQVTTSAIWTATPQNPDVLLVASRLGPSVEVVRRDGIGVGVTVIVGDEFEQLVRGKKSIVAEGDADICSPPVS